MKNNFTLYCLTTILCSLLTFTSVPVNAQTLEDGTSSNPYRIESKQELMDFHHCLSLRRAFYHNGHTFVGECTGDSCRTILTGGAGSHFLLTTNIVFNEGDVAGSDGEMQPSWTKWIPMESFNGVFDGGYHTISGLICDSSMSQLAFITSLSGENAVLKNLGVTNSYFRANSNVGGLVGEVLNNATVTHCFFEGTLDCTKGLVNDMCGGIASLVTLGTITECYTTGRIYAKTSSYDIGGVTGRLRSGSLTNCYTSMYVPKTVSSCGAVCGRNDVSILPNCHFDRQMTDMPYDGSYPHLTAEMTSATWTALGSAFVSQDGFYPYLSGFDFVNNPDVRLSVIPIFLHANSTSDYETMDDLHTDFVVGSTPGATWSATSWNNCVTVDNSTDSVHLLKQGIADLVVTLNGHTRTFILYPNLEPYIGSEQNAFTIDNLAELKQFRDGINGGEDFVYKRFPVTYTNLPNIHWLQTADIDVSSVTNWTPVGTSTLPFTGYYHGDGHTISKVKITASGAYKGLFGKVINAEIMDLCLSYSKITGTGHSNSGALIGYAANSSFYNLCGLYDTVTVSDYSAGLIGNISNCNVRKCRFENGMVTITGARSGGLLGNVQGSTITECELVISTVSSSDILCGGIAGQADNSTIKYCKTIGGLITQTGRYVAGGIVGELGINGRCVVVKCENSATVYAKYTNAGIAATIYSGSLVDSCVNYGKITSYDFEPNYGAQAGGIGNFLGGGGTIRCCINYGDVEGIGVNTTLHSKIGGIVGTDRGFTGNIQESINLGKVSGYDWVGGISGSNCKVIQNSCNYGEVKGETHTVSAISGYGGGTITSTYSVGRVISAYGADPLYGGAVTTISNNYYDIQMSPDNPNSSGKLTREMLGTNLPLGDAYVYADSLYPRLAWTVGCSWANSTAVTAASPLRFDSDDQNVDQVKRDFRLAGCDSSVVWSIDSGELVTNIDNIDCNNNHCPATVNTLSVLTPSFISANSNATTIKTITLRQYIICRDTLTIDSVGDLVTLREGVNSGEAFMYHDRAVPRLADSVHFRVTTDLTMPDTNWNPIGHNMSHSFKGFILGDNHTIDNLHSKEGLFGVVSRRVQDLNFTNVSISGSTAGAVCSLMLKSQLINCSVTGTVSGDGTKGGLVGYALLSADIVNCTANVTIDNGSCKGGIIGKCEGEVTICNCVAKGSISGGSGYTGGIVGLINKGRIVNCVNWATITCTANTGVCGGIAGCAGESTCNVSIDSCANHGDVKGGKWVAGISTYGIIKYCYNTGNITGNGTCSYVSGVGGGTCVKMYYCYNVGTVTAEPGNSTADACVGGVGGGAVAVYCCYNAGQVFGNNRKCVGGILGYQYGPIERSYNSNTVRGTGSYVGAVAGHTNGKAATKNYYDNQLNNITAFGNTTDATDKAEGKATENMLSDSLSGLGSTAIWIFQPNLYPQLACFAGTSPSVSSVMPVKLSAGETWNHVHSAFYMHGCQLGDFTILQGNCLALDTVGTLCQMQLAGPAMGVAQVGAAVSDTVYRKVRLLVNIEAPLIIKNKVELCNFRNVINNGLGYYKLSDQTYQLSLSHLDSLDVGDFMKIEEGGLDLTFSFTATDAEFTSSDGSWTPIGNSDIKFQGDFMGNNRIIKGLNLGAGDYKGLFGWVYSSHIDNLTLSNAIMTGGSSNKGILCGRNTGGVLDNCAVENSSVSGASSYTGVLCGASEYGTIKNCYVQNCTLNSSGSRSACVVGNIEGSTILKCFAKDCTIHSTGSSVGGIVGDSRAKSLIDSCYADNLSMTGSSSGGGGICGHCDYGNIKHCQIINSNFNVSGDNIGGICGSGYGDGYCYTYIQGCANINTQMNTTGSQFGGIMGCTTAYASLDNCYCTGGSVISTNTYVGGIVGKFDSWNGIAHIWNCHNDNRVEGSRWVGGIAGRAMNGSVSFCYNTGSIYSAPADGAAGIVGWANGGVNLNNCYNTGSVISAISAGGIVSGSDGTGNTITQNFNLGMVSAPLFAGGIVGRSMSPSTISYNYNFGIVEGISQVGGIMGTATTSTTTVDHNYNAAWVQGGSLVGAICGYTPNTDLVTNNIYDSQMSHYKGVSDADVAGTTPKLTTEMLGDGLQSVLQTTNWVYTPGMYPRLKIWDTTDAAIASAIPVLLGEDAYGSVLARDIPQGTYRLGGADTVEWVRYQSYGVIIDNVADTFGVQGRGRVQIANVINGDTLKVVQLVLGVSEDHPLEIVSKEQFLTFRDFINAGVTFYYNPETKLFLPSDSAGTYIEIEPYGARMFFKLTCDVDLLLDAEDWTPIGAFSASEPNKIFKGHFNGDGHTVKGVKITATTSKDYQGLFGYLQGTVKNLTVEKPNISSSGNYHGAIAGYNYGTVINCHSYGGTVKGTNYVGGLVGNNTFDQMEECSNGNNVSGTQFVGGIAGQCTDAGIIKRCFNYGMISATASESYVGGITGSTAVEISHCYNTGAINGHLYTAGIAGRSSTSLFRYCYNAAWVNSDQTAYVGAITTNTAPTGCYYDRQLCPDFEGLGTASGSTNSGCTFKYTEEMTGNGMSDFSSDIWTFTPNEYPRLTTMAGLDASIVSVKPIFLTKYSSYSTDHMLINKVAQSFTVQQGNGVIWNRYGLGRALNLTSLGEGKADLDVCGEDTLRVSLNNTYRLVPLYVYELGADWLMDTACNGYYLWVETGRIYTSNAHVEVYVPVGEDGLGCNRVVRLDLIIPPVLDMDVEVHNRSCYGVNDDYITATITGGFNQGYLYFWINEHGDTVSRGTTSGVSTLMAPGPGNYHLSVYDKIYPKCDIAWDGTITEPDPLIGKLLASDSRCWGVDDGMVTVEYGGGRSPYDVHVLNGTTVVDSIKQVVLPGTHTFNSLLDGTYTVSVADANGCTIDSTFTLEGDNTEYNITAMGVNKMYDGVAVDLARYIVKIGSNAPDTLASGVSKTLANGDILTATVSNTATVQNVTSQTNSIATLTITRAGEDVSCYYHKTGHESDVDVIISKRDVILTSADSSREIASTAEPELNNHKVTVGGHGFAPGEDTASISYSASIPGNVVNIVDNAFTYTLKSNTLPENYNITTVFGKLIVYSGIVVRTDGAFRKYNGEPLTAPGFTVIGAFGVGDTVKVEMANSSVTDCGWVLNDTASVRFVRKDDMTSPASATYHLDAVILDTLRVLPREVTLTTANATKVYDGTPLTQTVVTESGDGFVIGEATYMANTSITHVGSVIDTIKLTKNASYKDTNYVLTINPGTLTVTKRPLTITGETRTLAYNGTTQTITGVETDLLSGHTLTGVSYSASGKDPSTTPYPGSFEDTTGVISIKDAGGHEVKENYSITLVPGSLTISGNPLPIKITSNDGFHKYDYTLYKYNNYTVLYNGTSINAVRDTLFPLGNGDTLVIRPVGTGLGITHVVENGFNDYTYYIKNAADENVTSDYSNITDLKGNLTIIPRIVTLKSRGYNEIYSGRNVPATLNDHDILRGGGGYDDGFVSVLGHTEGVNCTLLTQESQVGKYINDFSYAPNSYTDINDYDIRVIRDTIKIVPAVLVLTVVDTSRFYGEENPAFSYTLTGFVCNIVNSTLECEDTCATGGTCAAPFLTDARPVLSTVATAGSPAGEYDITADITNVALANYRIEVQNGILKVRPRVLTIEAFSLAQRVYDGQEHSWMETTAPHYQVTSGLMMGDTVTSVVISGSRKLAGVSTISLNNAVVKHYTAANHHDPTQWEDVTQSYAANYVNGSITIVPDTITLKPYPFTHVFTGHTYTSDSTTAPHYSISPAGALAANNDKIVAITITGSRAAAGKSVFEIDGSSIRIVNASTTEANYDNPAFNNTGGYYIKLDTALLEVSHRTSKYNIVLQGVGDTVVYNGNEQTVSGIVNDLFEFDGFQYRVEGVYSTATSTDTGNTATTITGLTGSDSTVRVYSVLTGENMTDEFNVTALPGNLRITPRPLTITAKGMEVQYDGLEHGYTDFLTPYEADNICSGERVSAIVMTGKRTLPGREDIHIDPSSVRIQHISPSKDVTANYTIVTVDSAIHITDRTVPYTYTLKAKGDTIDYDGVAHQLVGFDTLRFAINVRTSGGEYVDVIYHIDPASVQAATVSNAKDTGNYVNTASFTGSYQLNGFDTARVLDASNVDVTKQFSIMLANNNFRIKPRPITFTANSLTRKYDGNTYTYTDTDVPYWTADNLVAIHTATPTLTCAGRKEVGSTPVLITGVVIKDADNNDVTAYYDTSFVAGAITITPNDSILTIASKSMSYTYDGAPHTWPHYSVSYGSVAVTDTTADGLTFTLPTGDKLTITPTFAGVTNVADNMPQNNVFAYVLENEAYYTGMRDTVLGTVDITPVAVTVTITGHTATNVYDGTAHSVTGFDTLYSIAAYTGADFVFSGTATATRTQVEEGADVDGKTEMGLNDTQFTNNNSNYDVTFDVTDGWQEITPMSGVTVEINGHTDTLTYNGYERRVTGYTVGTINNTLYTAADLRYKGSATDTVALGRYTGSYPMGLDTNDFENTNANFKKVAFLVKDGNLTIKKNPNVITITGGSASKVYDGTPLTSTDYTFTAGVLAAGDTLIAVTSGSITDVGTRNNEISDYAVFRNETLNTLMRHAITSPASYTKDVTDQYTFAATMSPGELKITPKSGVTVNVTGHIGEFNYDGTPHTVSGYDVVINDPDALYAVTDIKFTGDSTETQTMEGSYPMGLKDTAFHNINPNFTGVVFTVTDGRLTIYDSLVAIVTSTQNGSCSGTGDGKATISVTGGKAVMISPRYTYTVSGPTSSTGNCDGAFNLDNLLPGNYAVTVTDMQGSTDTTSFTIFQLSPMSVSIGVQPNLCPMQTSYAVEALVSGGSTPYQYDWYFDANNVNDAVTMVTRTLSDDSNHEYKVAVKVLDNMGCEGGDTVTFTISPSINSVNTKLKAQDDTSVVLAYGRCDTLIGLGTPELTTTLTGMPISITNNAPAGYRFSVGTYTVVWTATDTCGFTVTDTQKVFVDYPPCGAGHDVVYDGFTYHTVRVGCECWLQENLRNTVYADGADVPVSYVYGENPSYKDAFGLLYSWYSAVRVPEGDNTAVPADSTAPMGEKYVKGICPDGWAIPTMAQFEDLWLNGYGTGGIKDMDAQYWLPGFAGTMPNCYFNARGAGYYDPFADRYCNLLGEAYFWTGEVSTSIAHGKCSVITHTCPEIVSQEQPKGRGQSIRCVEKK